MREREGEREGERERKRKTERERERKTERDRERQRETERDSERERNSVSLSIGQDGPLALFKRELAGDRHACTDDGSFTVGNRWAYQ